jgi:hypothetical protein
MPGTMAVDESDDDPTLAPLPIPTYTIGANWIRAIGESATTAVHERATCLELVLRLVPEDDRAEAMRLVLLLEQCEHAYNVATTEQWRRVAQHAYLDGLWEADRTYRMAGRSFSAVPVDVDPSTH